MDFVIVDMTTPAGQAKAGWSLANGVGATIAAALMVQANRDCAPFWGGAVRVRMQTGTADGPQPFEIPMVLVDDMSILQPGDDAFHTMSGTGVPSITVGAAQCQTATSGPNAASVSFSHELLETMADASLNAERDAGDGWLWHQEICDEVQENSYTVSLNSGAESVDVSNFVTPAFYNPLATAGPFDFMGVLSKPFTLASGGYITRRPTGGSATDVQIFGKMSDERAAKKRLPSSRTYRRGGRA
jgi:hypothetical protein